MSDAVIVALIAGGALIVGQVATLAVTIIKDNKQSKQLIEIRTLADGNLTKVTHSLEVANQKIEGLQKLIGSMVEAKKDLKDHDATESAKVVKVVKEVARVVKDSKDADDSINR